MKYLILLLLVCILPVLGGCHQEPRPSETPSASVSEPDFDLINQESIGLLKLGLTAEETVRTLGSTEKKSDLIIWGADGLEHQTWYYPTQGVELDLVRTEKGQNINMIIIQTPCRLKTSRNIGIGSLRADVVAAYGQEIEEDGKALDGSLVAGSLYGGVIFKLEDDKVVQIFIGAAAE